MSSTQQHHPWISTCICTGSRGRPRCDVTPDQRLHVACILDSLCRMMLAIITKQRVVAGNALLCSTSTLFGNKRIRWQAA
jgi:hypothetical protein